jgi:hypothetical protein
LDLSLDDDFLFSLCGLTHSSFDTCSPACIICSLDFILSLPVFKEFFGSVDAPEEDLRLGKSDVFLTTVVAQCENIDYLFGLSSVKNCFLPSARRF